MVVCLQLFIITAGIAGKSKEKVMIDSEYHCIYSVFIYCCISL